MDDAIWKDKLSDHIIKYDNTKLRVSRLLEFTHLQGVGNVIDLLYNSLFFEIVWFYIVLFYVVKG